MSRKRKRKDRKGKEGDHWREAVWDLRRQLGDALKGWEQDKARYQTGRLLEALMKRIERGTGGEVDLVRSMVGLFWCYWFIRTSRVGYDEPLRLHALEIKAVGLGEQAGTFCSLFGERFKNDPVRWSDELLFRLGSICSWIEAQESFAMWLAFKGNRAFWRADGERARERAFQAGWLAELPSHVIKSESPRGRMFIGAAVWEGVGLGYDWWSKRKWSRSQWASILRQAAWLAEGGGEECTPLEEWVWWCYPVFRRYGWSAREVLECCCARFREDPTGLLDKEADQFGRYWMTRGLRFSGKKTSRKNPPLAELVITLRVPNPDAARGIVIF